MKFCEIQMSKAVTIHSTAFWGVALFTGGQATMFMYCNSLHCVDGSLSMHDFKLPPWFH